MARFWPAGSRGCSAFGRRSMWLSPVRISLVEPSREFVIWRIRRGPAFGRSAGWWCVSVNSRLGIFEAPRDFFYHRASLDRIRVSNAIDCVKLGRMVRPILLKRLQLLVIAHDSRDFRVDFQITGLPHLGLIGDLILSPVQCVEAAVLPRRDTLLP